MYNTMYNAPSNSDLYNEVFLFPTSIIGFYIVGKSKLPID